MITRLCRRAVALVAMLVAGVAIAGQVTYYHNDLAGSPVAATNASGQVIWRESYRPYGERLTNAPASSGNKVWFTSRRQDAETGLVYMGARYYDPVVGRFIGADPVGFDVQNLHSHNRYAYANNNPYRYLDPSGRSSVPIARVTLALGSLLFAVSQQQPDERKRNVEAAQKVWRGLMLNESNDDTSAASDKGPQGQDSDKKVERPDGIPDNWVEQPGKKEGNTKWVNPDNEHDYVRAKPDGTLTQVRDGKAFDAED